MMQARTSAARWTGFSVLLLFAVMLQIMVFPRIQAVPNPPVSVVAAVSLAVFSGVRGGAAAGFACGLVCDALMPGAGAYFALTTMAAGALTGFLCSKALQKNFFSALLMSAASLCVIEFFYALPYIASGRAPWGALVSVGLPAAAAGIACLPLVYPAFRGVAKVFARED